jgi:hypothetical protein
MLRRSDWLGAFRSLSRQSHTVIGAMTVHAGEYARYFSGVG